MIIANVGFWSFIGGIILAALGFVVAVISVVSTTFFIISMIFLGFWIHRKRNKLDYQKIFKVSFIIYLSLSILTVVVPATYAAVSVYNTPLINSKAYPDTKENVNHIETHNFFTFDGVKYVNISDMVSHAKAEDGKTSIANPRGSGEIIYKLENDSSKMLLEYNGELYCAEDDIKHVVEYYNNPENYDYYTHRYGGRTVSIHMSNEKCQEIWEVISKNENKTDEEIPDLMDYDIIKESHDGVYSETRTFVQFEDKYYVKSETGYFLVEDPEIEHELFLIMQLALTSV